MFSLGFSEGGLCVLWTLLTLSQVGFYTCYCLLVNWIAFLFTLWVFKMKRFLIQENPCMCKKSLIEEKIIHFQGVGSTFSSDCKWIFTKFTSFCKWTFFRRQKEKLFLWWKYSSINWLCLISLLSAYLYSQYQNKYILNSAHDYNKSKYENKKESFITISDLINIIFTSVHTWTNEKYCFWICPRTI